MEFDLRRLTGCKYFNSFFRLLRSLDDFKTYESLITEQQSRLTGIIK